MAPVSLSEPPPSQNTQTPISGTCKGSTQNYAPIQVASQTSSRLPVVVLDVDVLTDTIAARLATSLLGHVLFLKNQIPLSVSSS